MVLASLPAEAVAPAAAPPGSASEAKIARAKDLFDKGYALLKAGDCERALLLFKRSLDEAPSRSSTINGAYCLNELNRPGEALDLYEDLLTTYAADLDEGDKAVIAEAVRELRKKVGSIELSANVDGQVTIDGRARGKLPLDAPIRVAEGEHVVRIQKEGYEPFERKVEVSAGVTVPMNGELKPEARLPPVGPAEQPLSRSYTFISAFGGYAIGGSLSSNAEIDRCSVSCSPVSGAFFGLRSGYRFGVGLSLELSFGYLSLASSFRRARSASFKDMGTDVSIRYELDDDLRVRGPFFGMGMSYRIALSQRFGLLGRATVGLASVRSMDPFTGTAKTDVDAMTTPVLVSGKNQILISQPAFIMPEVGVEAQWGSVHVGLLLGIAFITSEGPLFSHGEVGLRAPSCTDKTPLGSVGCAPNQSIVSGENAYGRFTIWVPQIAVGYSF